MSNIDDFLPLPVQEGSSAEVLDTTESQALAESQRQARMESFSPLHDIRLQNLQRTQFKLGAQNRKKARVKENKTTPLKRRQGWNAPGPGAPPGTLRSIPENNVYPAVVGATSRLLWSALTRQYIGASQQEAPLSTEYDPLSLQTDFRWHLSKLLTWSKSTSRSLGILSCTWLLHGQFGIPATLLKINRHPHAIVLLLNSGEGWTCSCNTGDSSSVERCNHVKGAEAALSSISKAVQMTTEALELLLREFCEIESKGGKSLQKLRKDFVHMAMERKRSLSSHEIYP